MAPVLYRVLSYVGIGEPSWPALHKKPIIPVGRVAVPLGVGPPDRGHAEYQKPLSSPPGKTSLVGLGLRGLRRPLRVFGVLARVQYPETLRSGF